MSSVRKNSDDFWEVYLGKQTDSEVIVQVHMSRKKANELVALETKRLAQLNPQRGVPQPTLGAAVMSPLLGRK